MGQVVAFEIPPKRDEHSYKRIRYVITYVPATKEWEWSFVITSRMWYKGTEADYITAVKSAKQHIDLLYQEASGE